jgi:TonB family protein
MTEALDGSPLARALGLALVQFLWQGAVIGIGTALVLIALRRAAAQIRYLVACFGLTMLMAAPVVTTVRHLNDAPSSSSRATTTSTAAIAAIPVAAAKGLTIAEAAGPAAPTVVSIGWLEPRLPLVVTLWSGGVLVLALQLARGWLRVGRIRRRATLLAYVDWPDAVRQMADRLGVTARLRLVTSALTDVPAVIGWLRPAIVVPASALTGLPPAHLDAILAHELAHVRRADYLVNVVQCVIETLLFYHPAVWWVSRQVRLERELCCDDMAVSLCADRLIYARALASLEELRGERPALAMAATGGDLLARVRRLVEPGTASGPTFSGGVAMAVVLTILLVAVSGRISGMPADVDRSQPSAVAVVPPAVDSAPGRPVVVPAGLASRTDAASIRRASVAPAERPTLSPAIEPGAQTVVVQQSQAGRGSIAGHVLDEDGGVIVGATVVVSSSEIARPQTTVTDGVGAFLFRDLRPGTYELTASRAGFRTARGRLQIAGNDIFRAALRLDLGMLTETVHVKGPIATPAARTAAPVVVSGVVDGRGKEFFFFNHDQHGKPTATDYFDAAKTAYQQGRLAEAESLTNRALELLRAAMPESPAAAGPPRPEGWPVRVGGEVEPPRQLSRVEPVYPAEAIAAGVEGMVYIEAVLAKNGSVQNATVVKGHPLLNQAALDAVRQWRYTATRLNGVPVNVVMTIIVNFRRQ